MGATKSKPGVDNNDLLAGFYAENEKTKKLRDIFGRNNDTIKKKDFINWFVELHSRTVARSTRSNDTLDSDVCSNGSSEDSGDDDDIRKLAKHFFQAFDLDKDGYLHMNEFVVISGLMRSKDPKEKLLLLFKVYDKNNDGYLDASEIEDFLPVILRLYPEKTRENFDLTKEFKAIVKKLDKNKDKKISIEEFKNGLLNTPAINDLFSIEFKSFL